jgi:hypothetical protein
MSSSSLLCSSRLRIAGCCCVAYPSLPMPAVRVQITSLSETADGSGGEICRALA